MKAIELSKEQEIKLLEMCNTLYPEHKWGFGSFHFSEVGAEYTGLSYLDVTHINHKIPCRKPGFQCKDKKQREDQYKTFEEGFVDNIDERREQAFFTKREDNSIAQGSSYEEVYVEGIHWFEFCMTHLVKKLLHNDRNYDYITEEHESLVLTTMQAGYGHPVDYLFTRFKKEDASITTEMLSLQKE